MPSESRAQQRSERQINKICLQVFNLIVCRANENILNFLNERLDDDNHPRIVFSFKFSNLKADNYCNLRDFGALLLQQLRLSLAQNQKYHLRNERERESV